MLQEFVKSVKETARKAVEEIHTALPAEILSFNASEGLATVAPKAVFKMPNGKTIAYPPISGVPVVFPQSGDAVIAFPIKSGDNCLLVITESELDYWMYGKETDIDLKFDLTNAIAIPSLSRTGNPMMQKACDEDAVIIAAGETVLAVSAEGVSITGNLIVSGEITNEGATDNDDENGEEGDNA